MNAEAPAIAAGSANPVGKTGDRGNAPVGRIRHRTIGRGVERGGDFANYPGLTHDHILACLAYARDALSAEKVFPSAA